MPFDLSDLWLNEQKAAGGSEGQVRWFVICRESAVPVPMIHGRKVGSVKTIEQKKEEHHDIISYLKRGYSIRNVAKLTGKGISTVQRIKADFNL